MQADARYGVKSPEMIGSALMVRFSQGLYSPSGLSANHWSLVNSQASTPLVDYTSIQTAITLASQILDPDTGNPLDNIEMKQLLVMPARLFHAKRLAAAGFEPSKVGGGILAIRV